MIIKVIILKDGALKESGKAFRVGANVEVEDWKGYELIYKKKAGQIPYQNGHGEWCMDGRRSNKYAELRRTGDQPNVTIEEYNEFYKPLKAIKNGKHRNK